MLHLLVGKNPAWKDGVFRVQFQPSDVADADMLRGCRLETSDKVVAKARKDVEKRWADLQRRAEDATRSRCFPTLPWKLFLTYLQHVCAQRALPGVCLFLGWGLCVAFTGKVLPGHGLLAKHAQQ